MNKKTNMNVYYLKQDITSTNGLYHEIIFDAIRQNGFNLIGLEKCSWKYISQIAKEDYVLVTYPLRMFPLYYLKRHRNYIYWFQGITPEEDYMQMRKKWRYWIFSWLERLALSTSKYKIAVSKYIFQYFESKYCIKIDYDNVFVMPCVNSDFHKESFYTHDKYRKNIFCYAGGLQAWQGFNEIVEIYAEIEKKYPNVFFKVFSKQVPEAEKILSASGIKNYSIDCVRVDEMQQAVAECKFGFIIREDNIVNNVATPTKLGTYLGNGVIPILNRTVHFFNDLSSKYRYIVNIDIKDPCSAIEPYFSSINADDIYAEYSRLFAENYDAKFNAKRLQEFLNLEEK